MYVPFMSGETAAREINRRRVDRSDRSIACNPTLENFFNRAAMKDLSDTFLALVLSFVHGPARMLARETCKKYCARKGYTIS